ncbi:MAG: hypothetical protein ACI8PT_002208 [Gammaproteobacteria bacterium]|jgi:hypothetical protein
MCTCGRRTRYVPSCGIRSISTPPSRASFAGVSVNESNCKVPRASEPTFPALKPEGMYRAPWGGVTFGDVGVIWDSNQGEAELASSAGQLRDHIALSVTELDAWITKLLDERVTLLSQAYPLGSTRAVLVEGSSREQLELVQAR